MMEICKLSDIAKFTTGKLNSNAAEAGGNYPFFTCSPEPLRINTYAFNTEAIILAGNNAEGNFHIQYYEGKFNAYQRTYVIESCDASRVNLRYLYYALKMCLHHFKQISQGTATKFLTAKILNGFELPIPTIEKQNKIASLLGNLDKKIESNEIINKNLLEQALAIYKDWFCDYALSDGTLPENWKITTIDAISSLVTRGIAPKYDDSSDQIVLNQKCIRDHTIDISLARRHLPKKINEKWISKGDLLINSTGTGTLGRVAQVWFEANNMTVDSHVTIVRPKDSILQSYIGFWGLSHESEIEAQHTGSTGQTELPRDRVKAMELPLPDEDTLSKFNELVIPMTSTVISNQEENARLSQLRDALLPKLMSGELDVSDIDL